MQINKEVFSSRKERFEEIGRGCPRYKPCPICYKCQNKASHLFIKCVECPIPLDSHTEYHRELMIRRENFRITTGNELQYLD